MTPPPLIGRAFSKLHGLGNDFIILDARLGDPRRWADVLTPEAVRALCRRGHGIGADGVILALPGEESGSSGRMRILNADGSEPEMCGNGLRCLAKWFYERGARGDAAPELLVIETGAGPLSCEVFVRSGGEVCEVEIGMGRARLELSELPMVSPHAPHLDKEILIAGEELVGSAVSMGNPHYVCFIEDPDVSLESLARRLGPQVETHEAFPRGTNVEFARAAGEGRLELWVWERGCGITQACGTGACATVAAATSSGRAAVGQPVSVQLPGGTLTITVAEDMTVTMRGPAVELYRGILR